MTTEAGATAATAAPAEELSLEDAANLINSGLVDQTFEIEDDVGDTSTVTKSTKPTNPQARPQQERAAQQESTEEDDAPPEKATGEKETEDDAPEDEESPQRELPRSWTKDKSDIWAKLDPELQDYLLEQDSKASKAVRQSQNEAADRQKALDAKLAEVEQVRKEYESKVPSLVRSLEDALQAEFGDIKTLQDVTKLQAEDPFRFQQWQIHQMKINAAKVEQEAIDKKNAEETTSTWAKHVNDESEEFAKTLSEADRGKLKEWNAQAPDYLVEKGFTKEQLNQLANGKLISIYDHRIQSLVLDGMKYQAIQAAPKAVASRPVPTVQKPGTQRVASVDAEINALSKRLDQSGSEEDGWALLQAQMKASSRRR